jgi:ferritin-like metal-binding protein YciE
MDGIPAFTENINMRIQYHELLSEVYRHQSMTDSAVFHLKKAFELKDQRLTSKSCAPSMNWSKSTKQNKAL